MNTIRVKIRLGTPFESSASENEFDGDALREKLLAKGFEQIEIEGLPHGNHAFFVEDDSTFIADSYMDLRAKLKERSATKSGRHYACLDDSRIEISSRWRESEVTTVFKFNDGVRIRKYALRCSVYDYFNVWKSLCLQLSAAADGK